MHSPLTVSCSAPLPQTRAHCVSAAVRVPVVIYTAFDVWIENGSGQETKAGEGVGG